MYHRGRIGAGDDEDAKPDLSPMIDCVFILLIFFIITTVFVEETGQQVNRPEANVSSKLEKNSILIAVTADSKVYYGGREVGVKGVQAMVKPLLMENADMNCIIQGDEAARHGVVTQVQDECLAAGVKKAKLTIATE
jgi:biopolymer transport protein ExbD